MIVTKTFNLNSFFENFLLKISVDEQNNQSDEIEPVMIFKRMFHLQREMLVLGRSGLLLPLLLLLPHNGQGMDECEGMRKSFA